MSKDIENLGSYFVGEIPLSLTYQFLSIADEPIDLTGFTTSTFHWGYLIQGQIVASTTKIATINNPTDGEVIYSWNGDEFSAPGTHAGVFYVNDGTTQYASLMLIWQVCIGVGTPPVV